MLQINIASTPYGYRPRLPDQMLRENAILHVTRFSIVLHDVYSAVWVVLLTFRFIRRHGRIVMTVNL